MNISILLADYANPVHASHIVTAISEYALDPMGGGAPIGEHVKHQLVDGLANTPGAISLLAYVDDQVVGLINAFMGFSTFKCKPLINVHDVVVLAPYRRCGIAHAMFSRLEDIAHERGCCKLTLEVLEGNAVAKATYKNLGFSGYELDPKMGQAVFWQKSL